MPPRPRVEPTDDWHQIGFLARAPGQRSYELIRPVVLFGQSPAERAAETGAAERTLYRQVARFEQRGLASFVPPPKVEKHRTLPAEVRQAILDAKREHPPLNTHELTTICAAEPAASGPSSGHGHRRPVAHVSLATGGRGQRRGLVPCSIARPSHGGTSGACPGGAAAATVWVGVDASDGGGGAVDKGAGGTLLARLRAILGRDGLDVDVVDYRGLGVPGDGDACHAFVTDPGGRAVAEGWGPTAEAALTAAVGRLRPGHGEGAE